jgi:hypothetical protein
MSNKLLEPDQPVSGSAVADDWPGSAPQSTRRRTGSRCAPGDLASGLGGWPIFAEMAGFFSKLFEVKQSSLLETVLASPAVPTNP